MLMLACFAGLAFGLAAIGVYGIMSYLVDQGTRELGIRLALGAAPRDLLTLVLRHGLWITAAGVFFGLVGAVALTRFMQTLLFGVEPRDPWIFAAVTLMLTTVAIVAVFLPARRAAGVDPAMLLR